MHGTIFAGGSDVLTIGRPGNAPNGTAMAAIDKRRFAASGSFLSNCFPYMNGLIIAPRSDILSIGRPGDSLQAVVMTFIGENLASFQHVPNLYRVVTACQRDMPAIGRPAQVLHYG